MDAKKMKAGETTKREFSRRTAERARVALKVNCKSVAKLCKACTLASLKPRPH